MIGDARPDLAGPALRRGAIFLALPRPSPTTFWRENFMAAPRSRLPSRAADALSHTTRDGQAPLCRLFPSTLCWWPLMEAQLF